MITRPGPLLFVMMCTLGAAFTAHAEEPAAPKTASAPDATADTGKPAESTPADPKTGATDKTAATAPGETDAKDKEAEKPPKPGTIQQATFGGGCFWCMEAVFQRVPGVRAVVSGYSGGNVLFPSYAQVSSGMTGHAEVIQVSFDPAFISYEKLLEVFWRSHDPTTPNAQGPDVGTQYRSIILYHNQKQKEAIVKVYRELKARRILKGNVVTQAVPFQAFFPAEAYHQNYYNNHPADPYSMIYIEPKFDVFRKMTAKPKKKAASKKTASPKKPEPSPKPPG